MSRAAIAIYRLSIALWVGGMLVTGFVVAPVLFRQIADRTLAGNLAGELFSVMAWVGVGCGVYLMAFLTAQRRRSVLQSSLFWIVLIMLIGVLAGKFGVQPVLAQLKHDAWPLPVMESPLRDHFAIWHQISSGLFLLQSVLGLLLVCWQDRGIRPR